MFGFNFKPFAVVSDVHLHNWGTFAEVGKDGTNSRLEIQLKELMRVAETVREAEGNYVINTGDMFHVRGSLAPSVLNPTMDALRAMHEMKVSTVIVPGNHDQERRDTERLSSAVTALEALSNVYAPHETRLVPFTGESWHAYVPWVSGVSDVMKKVEEVADGAKRVIDKTFLFLHAPMNDVLPGIPDSGLDPAWLAKFGFAAVFCGHYHNHKEFPGNVFSVGALTHQTWSDIGTRAGFLIVSEKGIKWHASRAPSFVELKAGMDPADVWMLVDGNYVRAKIDTRSPKDVDMLRDYLLASGAKGVILNVAREASVAPRATSSVKAGASIEVSVANYVLSKKLDPAIEAAVLHKCDSILNQVRSAA